MKNLLSFLTGKKSVKVETQPVQIVSESKIVKGVFKVSDNGVTRIMEGVFYNYPMMKIFISPKGALVSSVNVELLQEQDITYTAEMIHALDCMENNWAMMFHQLADIA
jgi:hypothetical protein